MLREETAANPERTRRALEGLRRYQQAERAPLPEPPPAVAETGGAMLRDYGGDPGSGSGAGGPPVVFVPSLINPPTILDLSEERSLLRWLAARGHRVLLLDWGWPGESRKRLDIAGHVEEIALPLLESLGEPADLVGYCLGGTMAAAAAVAAPARARSLATIAAPWRFSGFPDEARARLARLWEQSRPAIDSLGLLPMEVLQSAFWSLDPARTIAKFESFAGMAPDSAEARTFVTLEDWANDGPPLAGEAARALFEQLFAADAPGTGRWRVAGEIVRPESLACPILEIVSTTDRIVPAATAMAAGETISLGLGHVGMVVGSRAKARLWEPLHAWLGSH